MIESVIYMNFNVFDNFGADIQYNDSFAVSLDDVTPYMVLKEDVFYKGNLLLSAGSKLTEFTISQLKRRGIKVVKVSVNKEHIPPQWNTDVNSTIDVATYNEVKKTLRNIKTINDETIEKLLSESKKNSKKNFKYEKIFI